MVDKDKLSMLGVSIDDTKHALNYIATNIDMRVADQAVIDGIVEDMQFLNKILQEKYTMIIDIEGL